MVTYNSTGRLFIIEMRKQGYKPTHHRMKRWQGPVIFVDELEEFLKLRRCSTVLLRIEQHESRYLVRPIEHCGKDLSEG